MLRSHPTDDLATCRRVRLWRPQRPSVSSTSFQSIHHGRNNEHGPIRETLASSSPQSTPSLTGSKGNRLTHTYVAPTAKQLQERIFKIVQQARPRAIQEARAIRLQCSHWSHALRRLWRGRVKAIYSLFKDLYNIKKSPLDHELAEIVVRDYIQDLYGMNKLAAKL